MAYGVIVCAGSVRGSHGLETDTLVRWRWILTPRFFSWPLTEVVVDHAHAGETRSMKYDIELARRLARCACGTGDAHSPWCAHFDRKRRSTAMNLIAALWLVTALFPQFSRSRNSRRSANGLHQRQRLPLRCGKGYMMLVLGDLSRAGWFDCTAFFREIGGLLSSGSILRRRVDRPARDRTRGIEH